jgi:hypothetical protein
LTDALEDFSAVFHYSRSLPMHINPEAQLNLITASDAPFYACRVILPWRFNPDIHLQFKSMVGFLYEEELVPQIDRRKYEVTLVPENYDTDVAMILLPLLSSPIPPPDDGETTAYRQFLWLLVLLKAVEEAMETEESDTNWEPETPFARIQSELAARSSASSQQQAGEVMTEIRVIIALLDRKGKVSKSTLLALLHSYTVTQPHLKPLADFLQEQPGRISSHRV